MLKKPMICAPVLQSEYNSALESAKKAIHLNADIIELRIDALKNPDAIKIQDMIEKINYPLIATNRMKAEGGFFIGSEEERIEILINVAEYVEIVDIELQTENKLLKRVIDASKSTIVSYHDFKKTPPFRDLLNIVKREKEIGDIAKFAVMPQNYKDTLTVLRVLSEVQNTIGISMGDIGRYTRLIGPIFGSPITFASIEAESAPGQLDIQTTKDILRKLAVIP